MECKEEHRKELLVELKSARSKHRTITATTRRYEEEWNLEQGGKRKAIAEKMILSLHVNLWVLESTMRLIEKAIVTNNMEHF